MALGKNGVLRNLERAEAEAGHDPFRFVMLRPHLDEGVPLARAATEAGVPLRTAQRWLARYR
jgi:putative transposase